MHDNTQVPFHIFSSHDTLCSIARNIDTFTAGHHQATYTCLVPAPVDELDDLLEVPHAASDAAHAVLQELPSHSSLSLGHLALLVQVFQQEAHKLNDGNYK